MANEIIRGMGTSHTAVAAVDFEKSLKFYAALGIKCFTQWGGEGNRIALLDVGDGTRIELFEKPELTAGEAALLHLAFSVQNVDEAYAAALRAGAVSLRAPEELPLVFDRFHKLDKSRSQNRDGWGLGRYIVKTIVCSHGENISVTSRDGKTEFTFTMPLVN